MLKKEHRLQKNKDFRRIYNRGKSHPYRGFVLYYRKNGCAAWRIGFSVSKKNGKAVQRNMIKRRFREACRSMTDSFKIGYDYIFIVRKPALAMNFQDIKLEIARALKECCLLSQS